MIKIAFLIFFLGALSGENKPLKIFPFEGAVVEYEVIYEGDSIPSKRKFYISNYGRKLCMDYRIFSRGEKYFIYIFTEEGSFSVNMKMKYGVKRKNPSELFDEESLSEWFREIVYGERKKRIMDNKNYKGSEKILGKDCEIYENEDGRFCIWNNLILKWERGNRIETVKNIQINISIPPERYKVPKGVWVFPKIF